LPPRLRDVKMEPVEECTSSLSRDQQGARPRMHLAALVALLRNSRKTERGTSQFLVRLAVRAAPFALLRNSRKTECGAGQFLVRLAVRAAPFALLLRNFAQNGVRRGPVPGAFGCARRTLCASKELAQNGVRHEPVPGAFGCARRTLCASKELRAKRSAARASSWSVLRCAPRPLRF
jgi:hypothetical protein